MTLISAFLKQAWSKILAILHDQPKRVVLAHIEANDPR